MRFISNFILILMILTSANIHLAAREVKDMKYEKAPQEQTIHIESCL